MAVNVDFLFLQSCLSMKYRFPLFVVCCFAVIGLTTNSCEKTEQNYIPTLFTGGQWELSSVIVTSFVGDTVKTMDTLYTTCPLNQALTFNTDKTCTFTNYSCISQPTATGHWSLSSDNLFLSSDMAVDSSGTKITPFKTARINNLGQYSLVLETGSLQTYYLSSTRRIITRYGFVRQKTQ